MNVEQGGSVLVSSADWLAELSTKARAQGDHARADHLLLLAWSAYDGQEVSIEDLDADISNGKQRSAA